MLDLPDPDWYLDNVLVDAEPGGPKRLTPTAAWQAWWRAQPADGEPMITARRQGFVVSTAQLDAFGVSRSARRTAVRRGQWYVPAFGTIAPLDPAAGAASSHVVERRRHALSAAAAILCRIDHVVAGRSAAIVRGLPTMHVPDFPELTAPNLDGLGRRRGKHAYGATLFDYAITHWFGVPLTSVPRTLVDLARHDRRDAIMAADAALRERLTTSAEIQLELADAIGWPGVVQAREVLALADPRAESPLESITRLALHDDGFPAPELQVWMGADRVDFYWPHYRLVLEADGRDKYSADQLWEEKKREQRLRGFVEQVDSIERVVWSDITQHWPATSSRLRRRFRPS